MSRTNTLCLALATTALLAGKTSAKKQIEISDAIQGVTGGVKMCAGYDDASDDYRVYYGPCTSTSGFEKKEMPIFSAEITNATVISGGDSKYLTDDSKVHSIGKADKNVSKAEKDVKDGDSTYALIGAASAHGTTDGDLEKCDACAVLGAAYYLVQKGKISTNYNTFPVLDEGKFNKSAAACICGSRGVSARRGQPGRPASSSSRCSVCWAAQNWWRKCPARTILAFVRTSISRLMI